MTVVVLFLSSNPSGTEPLELIKEKKEIDKRIRYLTGKEVFKIEQHHDISKSTFIDTLLDYDPQIVHFSGHGSTGGTLIFKNENGEPEPVSSTSLEDIFKVLAKNIFLVFLNACYSEEQARAISKYINCVVGMATKVYDETARDFSAQFYSALAKKKSVQESFDLAVANLKLLSKKDLGAPILINKEGIDPTQITLDNMGLKVNTSELCSVLPVFRDNLIKLNSNEINIQEFFQVISEPISNFVVDPKNERDFGQVKVNSIAALYNNLSGKVSDIINKRNIGDESGAMLSIVMAKNISVELLKKLDEICK
jgi:hypothetical protein